MLAGMHGLWWTIYDAVRNPPFGPIIGLALLGIVAFLVIDALT